MHKKNLLIVDTSVKSSFFYPTDQNPDIEKYFNTLIEGLIDKCDWVEGDYKYKEMPFSFLEYIGCGKLLAKFSEAQKKELESCFFSSESIGDVMNSAADEQYHNIVDEMILQSFSGLDSFFMHNVDLKQLISKANEKLSKYPVHENVKGIECCLRDWISDLRDNGVEGLEFLLLRMHLVWNMMIKHKWSDDTIINSNFFYQLVDFYVKHELFKYNLPCSALFEVLKGRISFNIYKELFDPSLIDLACRGYFDEHLNKMVPVTVLSTDVKKQKERLKNYIKTVKSVNGRLGKDVISFVPGYFVLVNRKTGLIEDVINIAQMIEGML